jgi:hypothetical protein
MVLLYQIVIHQSITLIAHTMFLRILLRKLSLSLRTNVANRLSASLAVSDWVRRKHLSELCFTEHALLGIRFPFTFHCLQVEGLGEEVGRFQKSGFGALHGEVLRLYTHAHALTATALDHGLGDRA